jgi:phosphatidyl-N-methylethanolamine N-methyltransferase
VILWLFLGAAAALTLERACYVWIARAPETFRRWCARPAVARAGEAIAIVRRLFYGFKALQLSVFVGWCYLLGDRSLAPAARDVVPLGVGGVLIIVGQALNWSVFHRLGAVGVFYGDRLGHEVPWCREFPFSVLSHPQYVGAVLSIWGFFLVMRFPQDDWIVLPALETLYYVVGTSLEEPRGAAPPATSSDADDGAWRASRLA